MAVLLIAVALGLVLRRRRRISLREPDRIEREPGTAPPRKGGTYKAESGFSFSSGTAAPERPAPGRAARAPPRPRRRPPAAAARRRTPGRPAAAGAAPGGPAAPPRRRRRRPPRRLAPAPGRSRSAPGARAGRGRPRTPPPRRPPRPRHRRAASPRRRGAAAARRRPRHRRRRGRAAGTAAPSTGPSARPPSARPPAPGPPRPDPPPRRAAAPPTAAAGALPTHPTARGAAPADEPRSTTRPRRPHPPRRPPPPAPPRPPAAPPPRRPGADRPRTAPAPTEAIDPAEGRLDRLRGRLARSRTGFGQGLLGLLGAGELDEESWEDVEATLLQADLGPEMTAELVETLRVELARRAVRTPAQARQLLRDVLTEALRPELDRSVRALPHDGRPAVLLVVGVNGTGKTTTTGKLARVLVAGGRHVVLGAADTFRAAAAEQLGTWGERAGATVVRGPEGADPASVAFDAVKQGTEEGADAVLLDTAGRLHTKTGLMDELGKVKRVVERQAEVDEVLLVLDATTGQNGLTQARVFGDVVNVTGIVLTKLDGTAKGGIVFRVQRELGVPVKLVGLGEGPDDLAPFEPAAFVDALLT